jgi:alginate O-acetyltransferase complex protein AlgI
MVFSGISFLFYFLPLFLFVYFVVPSRFRNWVLLIGSIAFYAWGAPKFVMLILLSTYIDFYVVRSLFRSDDPGIRKRWLITSLSLNLGLLAYFKYANFFVENFKILWMSMGGTTFNWLEVALPIGISFYTFQTITYAVDVYRKQHDPLKKPSDYMMYIMMFPQLIAGPIIRYHEIADDIKNRKSKVTDVEWGIVRFCLGLAKKVLIANVLAKNADEIFRLPLDQLSCSNAWLAILAYTFQIYFDFSGYSDMAIGLGRILGFKFPENFNNPYTSTSITDFWRRWHITLGRFMRDYLYIPLGGNRGSLQRTLANLLLVFMLSGLWHGASWNFVIWGLFHGAFLLLDRLFLLKFLKRLGKIPSVFITFFIVMMGWVWFRIDSVDAARNFYQILFDFNDLRSLYAFDKEFIITLGLAIIFAFFILLPNGVKWHDKFYGWVDARGPGWFRFVLGIGLFCLSSIYLISGDFNPFIYFRF